MTQRPQAYLLRPDNRLFASAQAAMLRWPTSLRSIYPLVVLLAGLAIPFVGQILIGVPLFLLASTMMEDPMALLLFEGNSVEMAIGLIVGFLPIFLLVWGWLRFFERRRFRTIGLDGGKSLPYYGRGLLVGLIMFGTGVILMLILGHVEIQRVNWQAAVWGGVLIMFIGWVVQGAAEEVLARGFLLPIVGARWLPIVGVILSSSIFGLLHLLNPNLSWLAMLNLMLFGVFAALYALWEEGLWGVFAIHSVWNWAQGNLFGLPVSGQSFGSDSILNMQETGPDLLTGGEFGPEGGLIVTLVLLVGCCAVWFVGRRQAARRAMAMAAGTPHSAATAFDPDQTHDV